ncbi:MAG TPA: S1C family serine protease [Candidatus Baltobacteraceae bacterium]|nr:S1C family serine protease [Candidatus Baltobacteraceae bacterium]
MLGVVGGVFLVALAAIYLSLPHHRSVHVATTHHSTASSRPTAAHETVESSYAKVRRSLAMVVSANGEGFSFGSAFCIKSDAKRSYFLTNHHVVGDASRVGLLLNGRTSLVYGDVIALGEGKRDLAVVLVRRGGLPALTLASDKAVEGQSIGVAGFPSIQFRLAESGLGLSPSMHVGTVNAIVGDGMYIEYDAQTDHGNSGGPLYDVASAQVYGVVTYGIVSTSSQAVQNNLAIAIPYARDVISEAEQSPDVADVLRQRDAAIPDAPPANTGTEASEGASPADTVREFYGDLNASRFADAYALLSPAFRGGTTFAQWRSGYATTIRSDATVTDSQDPSDVPVRLVATDERNGVLRTTVYEGQWSLVPDGRGGWLLDTGRLHRVDGD